MVCWWYCPCAVAQAVVLAGTKAGEVVVVLTGECGRGPKGGDMVEDMCYWLYSLHLRCLMWLEVSTW